ncbi:dual specificity protein phosphatase 16 isoform X1 [Myotis daubentonii]|uniref:dual specificity protein phosphatase 16 isoform X1 n=1 Tax=Myotis daubentonii TaxID=98922 RepID=UPI00287383D2|nr:dual specificity protein phosphatase 16 isoform X1 [Myotis daubentonii]XP_059538208.1 dual specificity protein phosphatase 16 isoform X1 [Myotis daubentonii]XP_059538209.1 dual specificity protein phosphatase 16 isoform X1 [Myotis daubentonii]XP_059538210.1 dual specificity protein phosphatase 16 isoform X1 [Myotis daubentonii]XP_059538211.1 dual specificity protein phosphatase 16 isoform X1 [Myotis daubentonii]XP_059538212.1 dual specificity protein phosphatase 16 isoform X1 [Myotis dauben
MAHEMIGTQIVTESLVALLESGTEKVLLIDSRPFVEYNTSHILEAININCSKLMKRRLQQDKVLITELIQHSAKHKVDIDCSQKVVVYDQSSQDVASLSSDCFLTVLLGKLEKCFSSVHLLAGGFAEFSRCFPGLCEGKSTLVPTCISQPCLPVANIGPTRILPNLYLGCQGDVLNKELMQQNGIGYVLNASNTCPKPDFIPESHFLRVPVNDSFCEKILPWLDKSVDFIEKAKASNGCVLVHCLAGISRSATIAIAYIMKRMDMSLDEAYRFVKEKRPTISPNFNFLGQLLDYEKKIKNQTGASGPKSKLKLLHWEKPGEPVPVASEAGQRSEVSRSPPCAGSATSEAAGQKPVLPAGAPSAQPSLLEDSPLVQALNGLHLSSDKLEDSNKLKRSFSLDIKSVSYSASVAASLHGFPASEDALDYYKPSATLDGPSKLCQFSPVEEVSEQTPEASPDKEEASIPKKPQTARPADSQSKRLHSVRTSNSAATQRSFLSPLHRSGSVEDNYHTNFLFGLSTSQQHLAKSAAGLGLKGWHSDILAPQTSTPSLTNSWYFATESSHFYSASAIYGGSASYSAYSCSQLPTCSDQVYSVRRRQKPSDRADSRRSWHEESPFEKQFKRRSCQMEFGESIMSENRSREELGKVGSQSSFSGSMEIIEVS